MISVMRPNDLMDGLPGEELVREGLADLRASRCTVAACLAAIARPRLVRAGLMTMQTWSPGPELELLLYDLLRKEGGDAYARYNSLLRELVSFEQALDGRARKRADAVQTTESKPPPKS